VDEIDAWDTFEDFFGSRVQYNKQILDLLHKRRAAGST
jgi:hypothetical protein